MAFHESMFDMYLRLERIGFDPAFIRFVLLPSWWDDSLAANSLNRTLAETLIAEHLKISVSQLADPNAVLVPPITPTYQLKCSSVSSVTSEKIRPSIELATRLAEILGRADSSLALPSLRSTIQEIRTQLVTTDGAKALETLLTYCWHQGIVVAHMSRQPSVRRFETFDGALTLFADKRPCILLTETSDSPAWLAFVLAHELGHLMLGHVFPGSQLIPDTRIGQFADDFIEDSADSFAKDLLYGLPNPWQHNIDELKAGRISPKLIRYAKYHGMDPAIVVKNTLDGLERQSFATSPLSLMDRTTGGRTIIRRALLANVDWQELSESETRFVLRITRSSK